MVDVGNAFNSNALLYGGKANMKGQGVASTNTGNQVSGGHEHPKSTDAKGRSELVLAQIAIQDFLSGKANVCVQSPTSPWRE